jgi:hypothetical protein
MRAFCRQVLGEEGVMSYQPAGVACSLPPGG